VLTRRGWLLVGGAVALFVAGRLLGLEELYILGAAAVALVVAALVQVRRSTIQLRAVREVRPSKVYAGTESRVELVVRNAGLRRTPVVAVRDPFDDGRRQARFLLAPLHPAETARAAYRLPTTRRGVYTLGPLELGVGDAFGLASAFREEAGATQLTVFPRVDEISPLPQTLGHDPLAGAEHPTGMSTSGDDFYALREYEMGDDLRRVNWRATARVGELMIRQDQMPWQGRATVVLDLRRQSHTTESLELAVSAAASIVAANWRQRSLVRLVTTSGLDSGWAAGGAHVEAVMEQLAVVRPGRHDSLVDVLNGLHRAGNAGALVVITANASAADLDATARLRGRFGLVSLVLFEPSSYAPPGTPSREPDRPAPAMTHLVRVTGAAPFPLAWNTAMATTGRRGRGARVTTS
jgi:uncharacterized protein (DUF58 family)